MKGYFTDNGKYRIGKDVIDVTNEDVKKKTVYNVEDKQAQYFLDAGKFCVEGQHLRAEVKKETSKKPDDKKE